MFKHASLSTISDATRLDTVFINTYLHELERQKFNIKKRKFPVRMCRIHIEVSCASKHGNALKKIIFLHYIFFY